MSFSSERLRMTRGKVDPVHQKSSPFSADPSSSADDCFELVLENGQIMMQGQSNRPRKGSISNNLPPGIPKAPVEIVDTDSSKLPKLTTVEHLPNDFALFAPTFEMGLDNEELVSWFDYAFPEPFNHYACSDMLPELSGVTMNGFPGENNLPSVIKRSSSNDMSAVSHSKSAEANASSSQQGIIPNAVSSAKGINESTTKEMSPLMQNQHMVLRSGNSELATSDVCNTNQLDSRSSVHYPSQMRGSTDVKLQNKFDERHHRHDNRPTTTNFSYFSEFASSHCQNSVANSGPLYCSTEKLGNEYKGHIWSGSHPMEAAPVNPSVGFLQQNSNFQVQPSLPSLNVVKESLASDVLRDPPPRQVETVCSQDNAIENSAKDDKSPKQALGSVAKRAGSGEKMLIAEPTVVASSVCSGNNSIERASNDPSSSYMKRKLSETGETEGPAEEVEQESIGPRKNAAAHTGLKRSRTAQVHNLSERRRRDRINEKMRALQELLPNCNKADKASMLEEAIEYLKTLQLQVQMLSMGARLFIPPMMVSAAMQHGGQMPYFQTMPMAMSAMGLGMGMQELNNGMMQMPYHMPSPCYTLPSEPSQVPSSSSTFNGLADGTKQGFVHPAGQGAQKLMLHIPNSPTNDPTLTGNISSVYSGVDVRRAAPLTSPNEVTQNVGSGTQG